MTAPRLTSLAALLCLCLAAAVPAAEPFAKTVGGVSVGDVSGADTLQVPFMSWGGDVALLLANGGLTTSDGSIFARQGLKVKLVLGDDFIGQVRDYLSGKSPFLRGTLPQVALAAELLAADPRTEPVVFLQMTWSAGDHLVVRDGITSAADLKGKKVALARHGPHLGLLDEVLRAAGLDWKDVTVVWTDDVVGPKGPAPLFRDDPAVAACLVITPDMQALTGGLKQKGTGAEGTVKGAAVLASTAQAERKHAVADVFACRRDFFKANREVVEKFTAGYLKACEELADLRARAADDKEASARYKSLLALVRKSLGRDFLENDAHADGLVADALFAGLEGNAKFFAEKGKPDGFAAQSAAALNLSVGQGYASKKAPLAGPDFDYARIKKLGGLQDEPRD